jgi:hypothetical protein
MIDMVVLSPMFHEEDESSTGRTKMLSVLGVEDG